MKEPVDLSGRNAPIWLVPAGALIAFLSTLCGVGGGLFIVPLLHYLRHFPMRGAVATAVVHVLCTALLATIAQLWHAPESLRGGLVVALGLSAVAAAEFGYWLSKRVDARALKLVFAAIAALAGWRMLTEDPAAAAAAVDATVQLDWRHYAFAMAVGGFGGSLTPLLGIGGGLVFMPALHLGIPSLDYNTVRACSLAVVTASSAHSTWLYLREGSAHVRSATLLGIGAAIGAVTGVLAVEEAGLEALARTLLAWILIYVAGRFAFDLWWQRRHRDAADEPSA